MDRKIMFQKNAFFSETGELEFFLSDVNDTEQDQWHRAFEILMPLSGSFHIYIDNTCYLMSENDFCIVPFGVSHRLIPASLSCRCMHLCISMHHLFSIPYFETYLFHYYHAFFFGHEEFSYMQKRMCSLLIKIYHLYLDEYTMAQDKLFDLVRLFINCSFHYYAPLELMLPSDRNHSISFYHDTIQKVCLSMKNTLASNFSVNAYAKNTTFSPSYLSSLFKKATGLSLYEYHQKLQLLYALDLLVTTDLSIDEIHTTCGFSSLSTFKRSFQSFFHSSPTSYRKKYLHF